MSIQQKKAFWPILAIALISTSAFIAQTRRKPTTAVTSRTSDFSDNSARPRNLVVQKPGSAQPAGPVQMVRFTGFDEGLRPSEVHASPGWVAVYFDDKTRVNSANLVIRSQSGTPLGQVVRRIGRTRGSTQLYLEPGRYQVFEPSQHRNSATLIVQP